MTTPRPNVLLPLLAGTCLAAATPPAWFPGAEFLVVVGLALWCAVASEARRPVWHSYLLGCLHLAIFSWSVHHVLVFAWAMIVLIGGLYHVLVHLAMRALAGRATAVGFAVAVAAACWLRANVPELWYPHGQPSQALWQWPVLLQSVVVGGEVLVNALLAWLGASLLQLGRSWRLGVPAWRQAGRGMLFAAGGAVALTVAGAGLVVAPATPSPALVDVAAVEPGFHLNKELRAVPDAQVPTRFEQLLEERLLAPTRDLLRSTPHPELVLWPESSIFDKVEVDDVRNGTARLRTLAGRLPRANAQLLVGVNVHAERLPTPAALQLDLQDGRVLAHQEKRHLVPGGEFQPFFRWLPTAAVDALRDTFAAALGSLPEALPGRELPPLRAPGGSRFGVLLCYDNAFPGPAAAQVAQGAEWLCVLSNESWYEGGGELTQLMAMTVLRALETGTPILRCTQDGWSGLVDGRGRLTQSLPIAAAPQPGPRILRASLQPGPGRLPPLAWLRAAAGPVSALALAGLLLHGVWRWARLRAAKTASRAAPLPR